MLHKAIENCTTCIRLLRKIVILEISRNLQFATLLKLKPQPNFLNVQTDVCNPIQPCAFLKFKKSPEITSAVESLFCRSICLPILCGILALNNFMEKFQEGLQVLLERTPPKMFCWKISKVVYKNLNIVFKIFSMLIPMLKCRCREFQVAVPLL